MLCYPIDTESKGKMNISRSIRRGGFFVGMRSKRGSWKHPVPPFHKYLKTKKVSCACTLTEPNSKMKKCVLIVEDNQDISFILDLVLKDAGYSTVTSHDGEGIVSMVEQSHPDLVLMDVQLGKNDGRSLCKLIKADHAGVPVILMSAHCNLAYRYKESDADYFIAKPFDIDFLVRTVDDYFRQAS